MALFNMHEAKTQLSRLVERAKAGEEIIIAQNGKPAVQLMAAKGQPVGARPLGLLRGQVEMAVPDAFDDEDEDINRLFYGDDDSFETHS